MEVKPGLPSTSFKLCVEQECVVAIRLEFDGVQVLHTDTTDVNMPAWEVLSNTCYSHRQNKHCADAFSESLTHTEPEVLDYVVTD